MTVAARTREAVRARPFLHDALAAGVVNYTAAARSLDVGEVEAVATALRRYAEELTVERAGADATVRMESGLGRTDQAEGLLRVGETVFAPGEGSLTAVLASGPIPVDAFREALGRCEIAGVGVKAAGYTGETLLVVVGRQDGPETLQLVESACQS